jgi:hypothetical protein
MKRQPDKLPDLVKKLRDAINRKKPNTVNLKQAQIEAEIIGYLIGLKVSKKQINYAPPSIGYFRDLPLQQLLMVAQKAASEILAPETTPKLPKLESQRE